MELQEPSRAGPVEDVCLRLDVGAPFNVVLSGESFLPPVQCQIQRVSR